MEFVVVLLPVGDDRACFIKIVGGIQVEPFVRCPVVERFDESLATGLTGWDAVNPKFGCSNSLIA